MNPKKRLRLAILRTLKNAGDFLIPDGQLRDEIALVVRPRPVASEINEAIQELDAEQKILGTRDEDGEVRWKVTTAGRAYLSEAGM